MRVTRTPKPRQPGGSARYVTPLDCWRIGMTVWKMTAEAQMIVTMRTLGMMGLWNTSPSETRRMVAEKPLAFAQSAEAALAAGGQFRRPDQTAAEALKPLKKKTGSNVTRLTRAGPKLPHPR